MNVMIMETDTLVSSLLQTAVVHWGHKVCAYDSPMKCPAFISEACPCELSGNSCPDVILVDMNMPGINGLKFVEELRRKQCRFCKIGMISDNWNLQDIQKALRTGASVFAKPFHMPSLHSWMAAEIKRVA